MKQFDGVFIREVWDFRLSTAAPMLYNTGETWVVKIHCNKTGEVLEEHDTGLPAVNERGERDVHDHTSIAHCYEWLHSVRDKYSRDKIEELKPLVAAINEANAKLAEAQREGA